MKTAKLRAATAALALAGLAACDTTPAYRDWFGELGATINEGGFGQPTANNIAIQSGEISYVSGLAARFASEVPNTITFEFNSAQLDAAARETLMRQANWIRQFPEVRFRVYGHTDAVGSNAYNKRLGRRRAEAVVAFFASQGIDRSRLEALVSFGEEQPAVYSEGPERRNRRTVTEVSGFVQTHPMVLNGKYAEVIFREYVASAQGGNVGSAAPSASAEAGVVDGERTGG